MPVPGADSSVLRGRLEALGFDDVRVAQVAGRAPGAEGLGAWLAAGYQADMAWMDRSAAKRADPQQVLPGARSMIMLGISYWRAAAPGREGGPRWARYALNEDYHDTIKPALIAAGEVLRELYGVSGDDYRFYVDTGPVLERSWAAEAGLGFTGKNSMLISRRHGNWLFLASILTRIDLVPDEPIRRRPPEPGSGVGLLCGKCSRCLDACPTQAFTAPGVLDARRCVSYQTIENRGIIPRELRAGIGLRIYGCDTCLEVCPWNRFAQEGRKVLLSSRQELAELSLREILELTPERFAAVFRRTAVKRLKLAGLLRNACIVAANAGATECVDAVVALAGHVSPVVRAHAVWAAIELGARAALEPARAGESDPLVLAEYETGTA
ncbi:MAG TPA: tRNA epoxyqueuosine(34) reductase QueG [Opitutaceae bacterium]